MQSAEACSHIHTHDTRTHDTRTPRTPHALHANACIPHARTGEQRRREYDWGAAGIDPSTHRFGLSGAAASRKGARQQASMKQILQPGLDEGIEVSGAGGSARARLNRRPAVWTGRAGPAWPFTTWCA
jgi:hypothetical protein